VSIVARPLWRIRLVHAAPRYLLYAACVAGLASSARFAIAPPRPRPSTRRPPSRPAADSAAQGYASLFARRYLSWDAARPQTSAQALAPMTGTAVDADAGLSLPPTGAQRVLWCEVVQTRDLGGGGHIYTVAAQTDTSGLLYLTVGVTRRADGALALIGYPAFVGPPAAVPAEPRRRLQEVTDGSLATVVERGLRNYLAASQQELAADLSAGARVAVPSVAMTLDSMQRLSWTSERSSLLATVEATDARGARYTLDYELDVSQFDGRWEISAIQTDPDS
jgi:Conjugative transposon protein TcpC